MRAYEVCHLPNLTRRVVDSVVNAAGCPRVVIGVDEDDGLCGGCCCPFVNVGHQFATVPLSRIAFAVQIFSSLKVSHLVDKCLRQIDSMALRARFRGMPANSCRRMVRVWRSFACLCLFGFFLSIPCPSGIQSPSLRRCRKYRPWVQWPWRGRAHTWPNC